MRISIDLSKLEKVAKQEALRALEKEGGIFPCPLCGFEFRMPAGENACPACGKTIETVVKSIIKFA